MSSSIKVSLLPVLLAALSGIALAQFPEDKIVASDAAVNDAFGKSVAISGDYAIVGTPNDDDGVSFSGSAYIFKRNGNEWEQLNKIVASDPNNNDQFGYSVAIDGDYAVVGAHTKNDVDGQQSYGAAYVFHRGADGNWTQQQRLIAENTETIKYIRFGISVDIDGDYVVVGAHNPWSGGGSTNFFNGAAYVYVRNNTTWTQQQRLVHPDPKLTTENAGGSSDYFGNSVSISGNYIIVGTPNDNEDANQAGAAYIFTRSNTSWSSPEQIVASDAAAGDGFGNSVAIDGEYAIVGAHGDDDGGSGSGSAYIFKWDGTSWPHQDKIVASDAAA
ncbi:MAG: FG-GAP repeat protein, partial [Alphaproteobacteria bacterium]|nr:FG-GAP repeat protein [Alphaproteobacteria bacterium]